jgi:hypothetical protein
MSGTTIKVNAVEAKIPKMKVHARPEKIGSSVITADPSIAAAAVSAIGRRRMVPASMIAFSRLSPRARPVVAVPQVGGLLHR